MYLDEECQYLQMMQQNIQRMAANSASIKKWAVTVATAFWGIGIKFSGFNNWLLLAFIPIVLFWYLDAYYLKLERGFRNREQYYINLKRGIEQVDSEQNELTNGLFDFRPLFKDSDDSSLRYVSTKGVSFTKSVSPLYLTLALLVLLILAINNGWFSCICDFIEHVRHT